MAFIIDALSINVRRTPSFLEVERVKKWKESVNGIQYYRHYLKEAAVVVQSQEKKILKNKFLPFAEFLSLYCLTGPTIKKQDIDCIL